MYLFHIKKTDTIITNVYAQTHRILISVPYVK